MKREKEDTDKFLKSMQGELSRVVPAQDIDPPFEQSTRAAKVIF